MPGPSLVTLIAFLINGYAVTSKCQMARKSLVPILFHSLHSMPLGLFLSSNMKIYANTSFRFIRKLWDLILLYSIYSGLSFYIDNIMWLRQCVSSPARRANLAPQSHFGIHQLSNVLVSSSCTKIHLFQKYTTFLIENWELKWLTSSFRMTPFSPLHVEATTLVDDSSPST